MTAGTSSEMRSRSAKSSATNEPRPDRNSRSGNVGTTANDLAIREQILAELGTQGWGYRAPIDVGVRNGFVPLWGPVSDGRVVRALRVAAKNVPGVKSVEVTTLP
jgi:osmotically-inducible protein OsmY